jgi:hypothetical protein
MKKVVLILVMFCLFSSCKNIAWIGYKKPLENDFVSLGASSNCICSFFGYCTLAADFRITIT